MEIKLLIEMLIKYILGIIITGLLLFLPAGTFNYPNAWLFIALLFIPIFVLGLVLWFKDKELLRKRLNGNEKENSQKTIIIISTIILIVGFIVAGLDFRYGWSNIETGLTIFSSIMLFISYIGFAEVLRENRYLSRNVEIQENQKVVDKGLYRIVRHPMYLAVTILILAIPIVLGSYFSLIIFCFYPIVLIFRIKYEEEMLKRDLNGYSEYIEKVKYRMIPFIW